MSLTAALSATAARYLLALASGGMLALSFPRPGVSFLAWFAFVPLFAAVDGLSPRASFRFGFCAGCAAYLGMLYWLAIVMGGYGGLNWAMSATLCLLLAAYLALYPAAALWLSKRCEERGLGLVLPFPLFWVAGELVRSYLLTGFPWGDLGYTQYRTLPLIQISDLTGVYGVSFLVALANVVFFRVWSSMRRKGVPYPVRGVVFLLVLLTLTLGYGVVALNRVEQGVEQRVLLVQGNVPQQVKWEPSQRESTVSAYERLTRNRCRNPGTLVVWPESALPFYLQGEPAYAARIASLAAELKSCLIAGSPAYEKEGELVRYLNSAFLITPQGKVAGRSDKLHLVPFGEYVPLASLFPFVNKLVAGTGEFSPGKSAVPLETGSGKVGVLICFEAIFPEISRAYVRAGAGMLVNITNDAWFGRSSAPYQHLSMTVFRAVENRVPLVRAANTGISAVIDSKGHVRGMTPLFEEATLSAEVKVGGKGSFYSRIGDLFALCCLAAAALLALLGWRRKPAAAGAA